MHIMQGNNLKFYNNDTERSMFYTNSFFLLNKLNVVQFDLIENRNVNQNCVLFVNYKRILMSYFPYKVHFIYLFIVFHYVQRNALTLYRTPLSLLIQTSFTLRSK